MDASTTNESFGGNMNRNLGGAIARRREPRRSAVFVAANGGTVSSRISAIAQGDYSEIIAEANDDVEVQIFAPRELKWTSRARGRLALRAAFKSTYGAAECRDRRIANVITQGNVVIVFGGEHGCMRRTGQAYDLDFVHRFTFGNGRLASVKIIAARVGRKRRSRQLRYGTVDSRKTA